YKWVQLPDTRIVQNLCALCWQCHQRITENVAWIELVDGAFRYIDPLRETNEVLVPQPKDLPSFATAMQIKIDGSEVAHEEVVQEREEPPCPTCGHQKRKTTRELPAGPRRNRASWTVSVPKDERENGADVLDALALACAEKLGRADHSSWKYYTLAEVLASFTLGHIDVADFVE
ncbi:MAG TPA: hypothetical protein VH080_03560, partial [Gemmatimonadaceae bacterium]|nr:hypothetical protein [Gemmatimonadaceae bacterium]